jgi:hypothetical protein
LKANENRFCRTTFQRRRDSKNNEIEICFESPSSCLALRTFGAVREYFWHCSIFIASYLVGLLLVYLSHNEGGCHVDLALRLNALAVFAVFVFVGAILLGAF